MAKKTKDKGMKFDSGKEFEAAVALLEEKEEMVASIMEILNEEYDYAEIQTEIEELKEAIRQWMMENDQAQVVRDDYKISLVRRSRSTWNIDKLKKVLGKGQFLKITRLVVDPDRIDDLVRSGEINGKLIESALEMKPEKPYLRWYHGSEDEGDKEADALKKAMG
jgi:FtsZ-binding cell division protein ZapB